MRTMRIQILLTGTLIVILALSALSVSAQEETPTPEVAIEPAADPSAAPPPAGVEVARIVRRFDFNTAPEWLVGDYDFIKAAQEDGFYRLTSTGMIGIVYSGAFNLQDFYAQVEVYPQVCPDDGAFGIAFRLNTNPVTDYYSLYVRCNNTYSAGVVQGGAAEGKADGVLPEPLMIDPEASPTPHVMGVLARGSQIDLYWDGERLGGFTDALRTQGELVLSVSPSSNGENVTIAYDNLTVWELPTGGAIAPGPAATAGTTEEEPAEALAAGGELLYSFTFTQANEWFVGEDAFVRAELIDEQYAITPLSGTAALFSNMVDVDDFYATVELYPQTCPPNAIIGFAFRQEQPGSYHVFGVRCDGAWLAQKLPPDVPPFLTGQLSEPIGTMAEREEPHTVAVLADGPEITIFWDGEELGTFEDDTFLGGDLGFHLQPGTGDELLTVAFDNLEVWSAPPAPAAPNGAAAPAAGVGARPAVSAPIPVGSVNYATDFENEANWLVGTTNFVDASIENGRYVLTSTNIVGTFWSSFLRISNFYAQYEVTPVRCPGTAAFGLPFRVDRNSPGDFYVAIMQCDGNWRLSKVYTETVLTEAAPEESEEGEEGEEGAEAAVTEVRNVLGEALVSGSLGAPLTAGQSYTLGVLANGSQLVFYWNGQELGRAVDETHVSGDIGFQVRPVFPTYDPITITIDYLRIWNLP